MVMRTLAGLLLGVRSISWRFQVTSVYRPYGYGIHRSSGQDDIEFWTLAEERSPNYEVLRVVLARLFVGL